MFTCYTWISKLAGIWVLQCIRIIATVCWCWLYVSLWVKLVFFWSCIRLLRLFLVLFNRCPAMYSVHPARCCCMSIHCYENCRRRIVLSVCMCMCVCFVVIYWSWQWNRTCAACRFHICCHTYDLSVASSLKYCLWNDLNVLSGTLNHWEGHLYATNCFHSPSRSQLSGSFSCQLGEVHSVKFVSLDLSTCILWQQLLSVLTLLTWLAAWTYVYCTYIDMCRLCLTLYQFCWIIILNVELVAESN